MYKLPNGKIVYQEDIQCVHDPINGKGGIFIGNLEAAQNLQTLKKHGIKAVLTAAKGVFLNHCKTQIPHQLYIPGQDHERFDISKYFQQSINFIYEALEHTNILVHCLAGVSRSVSLVMAYFIKHKNMNYQGVYSKIKSRRKIIHPNDGFITQLKKFEQKCRMNGQTICQYKYDHRSSYSPSKRYHGQSYKVSPQKYYQSPSKRGDQTLGCRRNADNFKYTQMENSNRFAPTFKVKNPQLYKSITGKKQEYQKEDRVYSPDRYQKEDRFKQNFALKRLSSMNIEQNPGHSMKRSEIFKQYNFDIQQRNRGVSDYKPLDSIQNRQYSAVNTDIDKKIAQIRKKYQEYSKQQVQTRTKPAYERKYSNISSSIYQPNQNIGVISELKMKKVTSGVDHQQRRQNNLGVGVIRNNYVQGNMTNSMIGNRLKRMQSYQDY